jgi:hypothetical protein
MLLEKKRDEDFYNRVIKTAAPVSSPENSTV